MPACGYEFYLLVLNSTVRLANIKAVFEAERFRDLSPSVLNLITSKSFTLSMSLTIVY